MVGCGVMLSNAKHTLFCVGPSRLSGLSSGSLSTGAVSSIPHVDPVTGGLSRVRLAVCFSKEGSGTLGVAGRELSGK